MTAQLNKVLRLIRIFHDLKQKELAEKLGISKSLLSEIESGKKTPTLSVLNRYAEVFQVPVSSIIFFSENINSDVDVENLQTFISPKIITLMKFVAEPYGRVHAE